MIRVPRLSSRQRLIARILPALVVLWAAGGTLLFLTVDHGFTSQIDRDLRASATRGAAVLERLPPGGFLDLTSEFGAASSDTALVLLRPDGSTMAIPSGDVEETDPLPDLSGFTLEDLRSRAGEPFTIGDVEGNDERYRAIAVALDDGEVVVSARSLAHSQDVLRQLRQLIVFSLLVSFGAVVVLVWVISRWALRPLEQVSDTAHRISAGNLDTRIAVQNSASDVERLAESINTMLARLEAAFAAKELSEASMRRFVAEASHELRTPLAAIIGFAELYQQHIARQPDQIDHILNRITAEGTRMQSLVEDLLLLARLDQGRPLERDAVDLLPIVTDALAAIRVIDPDRTYVLRSEATDAEVIGDSVALRQIVDNLLTNVAAHTPPATTAEISLATDLDSVTLSVSDDGPGMTAGQQGHAFDRFWRAEASRAKPSGSGLGLAIVADLVRAQNGTIELQSELGRGATFTLRIPHSSGYGPFVGP